MNKLIGKNVVGKNVKVVEDGLEFVGKVKIFDNERGKLGLVMEKGELQLFHSRFVESIIVLDENENDTKHLSQMAGKLEMLHSPYRGLRGGTQSICYCCNRPGHFARECPSSVDGEGSSCFRCGQKGHFAAECPTKVVGGGSSCFRCDQEGHIASECPTKIDGVGSSCFRCGQKGHLAAECSHSVKTYVSNDVTASGMIDEEQMKKIFNEVKPENKMNVMPGFGARRRNDHLSNLSKINMDELLGKESFTHDTEMNIFKDSKGFEYSHLPAPTTTSNPRLDVNGHVLNSGFQQRLLRKKLWEGPEIPPNLETPDRLYVVQELGDLYEEAVERTRREKVVGLNLQGVMLGRKGELCWLSISTNKDVFMFDIMRMGDDAFKYGLRSLLQDPKLTKVLHDSRQSADILVHQYNINLAGMWDTLAGDIVFSNQHIFNGLIPRYSRSVGHLLRDYLGLDDGDIFYPRYRRTRMAEDTAIWRQRPLPLHLVLGAARSVIYLPALYKIVRRATLLPFNYITSVLSSHVREKDDMEASGMVFEGENLPARVGGLLPDWQPDKSNFESSFLIDGNFIHQNVGNPDPVLIFSKDSMHQGTPRTPKYAPFQPPVSDNEN